MNILDKILEIGDCCLFCDLKLSFSLIFTTEKNNSYSYRLTSKEYPILFTRTNPITMYTDLISLEKNDRLELPYDDINRIVIIIKD